ncbi:MAG: hypothetical protein MJ233_03165 [Mycoplasmoidaceae bacterium]|nr:hypothetical protein [Mycoplasmoidaceae bacterium]
MDRLQKLDLSRIDSTDDILFKVESAQPTFFAATGSISKKIKIKLNSTLKTPEKQAQVKAALIANGMNESYITFEE